MQDRGGARTAHMVVPGSLLQNTGGYRYDRRIVEGLRQRGWDIAVHELPEVAGLADESAFLAADIALSRIPDTAPVVVDGLALPAVAGALALESHRLRFVALVHHPLCLETGLTEEAAAVLRNLERVALARVRRIVVPSARTRDDLLALGLTPAAIDIVAPGTDPAPAAAGMAQLASADAPPSLLAVGHLSPRKGFAQLLEALAGIADLPWTLTVAGSPDRDPPHAAELSALAAAPPLAGRVAFVGECTDEELQHLYRTADLFVQASHHEGYGMALGEALAHGLPVVATATGAAPELVAAGHGLLVPPGDTAALREALRQTLSDAAALRRRRAAPAASLPAGLSTWNAAADRWSAILEGVAA